ncbi:hypothetical protein HY950_01090 [Candidatus Gottesmanbacteria bacterium]|nr:hypothetical protein [Candidatus Gottesmanbacteria bacterium]
MGRALQEIRSCKDGTGLPMQPDILLQLTNTSLSLFHFDYEELTREVFVANGGKDGEFTVLIRDPDGAMSIGRLEIQEGKWHSWGLLTWTKHGGEWTTWAKETGM